MGFVFSMSILSGIFDIIMNLREHVHIDTESLKDMRYQQDVAFQSYLSLYGKNYKDSNVYDIHKNEFCRDVHRRT